MGLASSECLPFIGSACPSATVLACVCLFICVYARAFVGARTGVFVCMSVCVCVCVCVCVEVASQATNELRYRDRSLDQVQAQIEEANRRLAGLVQPAQSPSSWQNLRPAQHGAGCASSHHRIHTRLTVHSPQHSVTDLIGRGRECQIHVGEVSLVSRRDARNV